MNRHALLMSTREHVAETWNAILDPQDIRVDCQQEVRKNFGLLKVVDQGYRNIFRDMVEPKDDGFFAEFRALILASDRQCRGWLKSWVGLHGWPGVSKFGQEVVQTAWLVGLHSDIDPEFQKYVLAKLTVAFEQGECSPVHYASIIDRIAINEDRPQQWKMFYRYEGGQKTYYPHIDIEDVEKNRRSLGLFDEEFHR